MHAHHHHGPQSHGERSAAQERRLVLVLALAAAYMVAEAVGGWLTGSLALLADAGHMLSDVVALSLSVLAVRMGRRPPTPQRTFGFYRTEILAALGHGILLIGVAIGIFVEAWDRFGTHFDIRGGPMLAVAAGGLVVNLIGLGILRSGAGESLNVRGAWLHVLSDTLGSLGAIAAGSLILLFGWNWADPVASLLIALLIVWSSWALVGDAVAVLMEGAPAHLDVDTVRRSIAEVPGVEDVHDLHVWTITSGMVSLSGHVVAEPGVGHAKLLSEIHDRMAAQFGIGHTTIQVEPRDFEDPGAVCPPGEAGTPVGRPPRDPGTST